MVNMSKAGEVGGFLDAVLLQIAENYEAEVKLRSKVKAAMTYPVVVFVIAILVVIGMLLFVVPVFAKHVQDARRQAAGCRRSSWSSSQRHHEVRSPRSSSSCFIAFVIVWSKVKHQEQVRHFVDPLKLKVPVFGKLFQKIALRRFARNLGTMMPSGVPILQSLDIVADTTGNVVLANAVRDVQDSVRRVSR